MKNNKDKLIIKILGSGSCVPRVERAPAGYLIKYKDKKFLLDCGPGILWQLVKAGEDYKDLTGVIFSHFHPDHSSDFIPLIQALDYTPGFDRKEELLLFGPPGLEKFTKSLYEVYDLSPRGYDVAYIKLDGKYGLNDELFITAIKGNHTKSSSIIKITYKDNEGKEKGLVYSGDTDFDPAISEFAKGIDLLSLECSFPYKAGKHLTPEEAGKIAQGAHPDKLLLTHFYPLCDSPDIDIQEMVKEHYSGQILIAEDFMEIII